MKKLIIDRQTWLRGDKTSCLLNNNKHRCCLGFLAQQCGIKDKYIQNIGSLCEVIEEEKINIFNIIDLQFLIDMSGKGTYNSTDAYHLMEINDIPINVEMELQPGIVIRSELEREEFLKRKFAEYNIDVEFIN